MNRFIGSILIHESWFLPLPIFFHDWIFCSSGWLPAISSSTFTEANLSTLVTFSHQRSARSEGQKAQTVRANVSSCVAFRASDSHRGDSAALPGHRGDSMWLNRCELWPRCACGKITLYSSTAAGLALVTRWASSDSEVPAAASACARWPRGCTLTSILGRFSRDGPGNPTPVCRLR